MPANVYTNLANATVYTDKLQITTAANAVTYQAYATALGTAAPVETFIQHQSQFRPIPYLKCILAPATRSL
jgi:hypothetical protein